MDINIIESLWGGGLVLFGLVINISFTYFSNYYKRRKKKEIIILDISNKLIIMDRTGGNIKSYKKKI